VSRVTSCACTEVHNFCRPKRKKTQKGWACLRAIGKNLQCGGNQLCLLFISPLAIVISTINHSYWSYQQTLLSRGGHFVEISPFNYTAGNTKQNKLRWYPQQQQQFIFTHLAVRNLLELDLKAAPTHSRNRTGTCLKPR